MENPDVIPAVILLLLACAVSTGVGMVLLARRLNQRRISEELPIPVSQPLPKIPSASFARRPVSWLAIRCRDVRKVQAALALNNATPCSWVEGLLGDKLFVASPIKGWVIVTGQDLPDPGEDVDACFRFLHHLSRKLGRVLYFQADAVLSRHAWAWFQSGKVVRAYAWAGRTVWNQGRKLSGEIRLALKCYDYFDDADNSWAADCASANIERIPLLAAQWSLDPATIDVRKFAQARGVAGHAVLRY